MAKSGRSYALDAFRGLAILGMALSGRLPWGTLPPWMYHAQTPPPEMKLNEQVFGITWVDLVFPFFLFSMGAAMPFALGKRLDKGESELGLVWKILQRGALLALFAIASQHFRPGTLDMQGFRANDWTAIGLFFAMLAAWGTLSVKQESSAETLRKKIDLGIKVMGWLVLIGAAILLPFKSPSTWDWNRSDIILLVLANVVVSGGLLYILSKRWKYSLWIAMAITFAAFLVKSQPWMSGFWNYSPVPWLFKWEFHKYLMIVIPGIWAGNLIKEWYGADQDHSTESAKYFGPIATQGILIIPIACFVFSSGRTTPQTTLFAWMATMAFLFNQGWKKPTRLTFLGFLGTALYLIGTTLEPIGGGIRKDSTTISYFFVTAGLACWLFLSLVLIEELRKSKKDEESGETSNPRVETSKPEFLALVGANPMIGYIVITNLAYGLVRVTGLNDWVGGQAWSPWGFAAYGLFQTLLVGIITAGFTKARVFMRT
jgi:hypothetical protein